MLLFLWNCRKGTTAGTENRSVSQGWSWGEKNSCSIFDYEGSCTTVNGLSKLVELGQTPAFSFSLQPLICWPPVPCPPSRSAGWCSQMTPAWLAVCTEKPSWRQLRRWKDRAKQSLSPTCHLLPPGCCGPIASHLEVTHLGQKPNPCWELVLCPVFVSRC